MHHPTDRIAHTMELHIALPINNNNNNIYIYRERERERERERDMKNARKNHERNTHSDI